MPGDGASNVAPKCYRRKLPEIPEPHFLDSRLGGTSALHEPEIRSGNMSKTRRNHALAFKAKVALEALKGEKTINEIAARYQVHPTQVTQWRSSDTRIGAWCVRSTAAGFRICGLTPAARRFRLGTNLGQTGDRWRRFGTVWGVLGRGHPFATDLIELGKMKWRSGRDSNPRPPA